MPYGRSVGICTDVGALAEKNFYDNKWKLKDSILSLIVKQLKV